MKLTIPRDSLAEAVAWAAHALTQKPAVPVLTGLLVEAADCDELTISAFDYDTSRRISIGADIAEPGKVLLPGRVLTEIVRALPKKPVDLALSGNEVTITCGSAEFGLLTMPVDDYPNLPDVPEPVGDVDGHAFAAAVAQVAPASGRDETIPMLTGIHIDLDGDTLTLAATDRYRIAARTLTWDPVAHTTAAAMIPGRTLADIAKSLGAGPVTLGITDSLAAFTGAGRTTTIRLLDPQFIDYNARLQLSDFSIWASVDAANLAAAVKRVSLVAERNTAVRLAFRDGEVLVQAGGNDIGRGAELVDAELSGDDIHIAFQSQYLLDALNGVDGQARIGMVSPSRPALIVPPGDNPCYRHLAMSLRLS